MEKQAQDYFRRIQDLGGVIPAIEKGFFQSEIADAAYRYQREIDKGERKIVGVNAYTEEKPLSVPILKMDPDGYERQVSRLNKVRKTRDNGRVGQTLDKLRIACQGTENTMPYIMECVHAYATLGEIVGVMKGVFGEYQESSVI
jgi:methylmalonyl-CoA mutase N-terminal domain/subunit